VLRQRADLLAGISNWQQTADGSPELRARAEAFSAPVGTCTAPDVHTESARAPASDGELSGVPLRIYSPLAGADEHCPGLIWVHGGGFSGGDLDMPESDHVAREIADRAGAVVVTVDYRLVDEEIRYPTPLEDVLAAWRWVTERRVELGADRARIFIGGASAGANLAAAATLRLRDRGDPLPAAVLLVYPALHPELPPPSAELRMKLDEIADLPEVLRISAEGVRAICERYTGGPVAAADGYAMPGLARLEGFPPTLVLNSEYDALRSSGETFALQLTSAGVPVHCVSEPGVLHGHLNTVGLAGAERSIERLAAVIASGRIDAASSTDEA
jgi:acetyl esterase/lipase